MLPTRDEALALMKDGLVSNPGPWGRHCLTAAHCAERIAGACNMDSEKAYILGLLHDIGRKYGVRHLGHVSDGFSYMTRLGFDEVAKVCLTHSFNNHTVDEYIGKFDTSDEELALIKSELAKVSYDEYDLLIQLCDSLAGADGVLDIEERMGDVKNRYGSYPQEKWDSNVNLMHYFEEKMGQDIYTVCEKDSFRPECIDIQATCNYAKSGGVNKIYIMSGEIGLYEKYGFEFIGWYKTIFDTEDQLFVKNIDD